MEQRYTLTGNTRAIMAMLAISMLLGSLGTSIANIALPALAVEFSVAFHQVQWVVVSYLAALTVSVLVVGQLGDRFGLKLMHLSGLGLFCFATIWCGLAQHFPMLVAGRVLRGGPLLSRSGARPEHGDDGAGHVYWPVDFNSRRSSIRTSRRRVRIEIGSASRTGSTQRWSLPPSAAASHCGRRGLCRSHRRAHAGIPTFPGCQQHFGHGDRA